MNTPLISVIVPVYKVEEYISKCIDSIINQTYKNLEIILVDDGSPDNCPRICDEYAKKDKRIKVIHKENGGLSDTRNKGIEASKGEYIGFVDSDDYIDNEMYEYLYGLISKHNADISMCGYKEFGAITSQSLVPENELILNSVETLKLLSEDRIIKNYAVNKLYNAKLFNNVEFPVGKTMEDISTIYKTIEKANIIVIGNKRYYNYLRRDDSIRGVKSAITCKDHIENTLERFIHFKDDKALGFCFYKSVYYVMLRAFVDYDDIANKYIDENGLIDKIVNLGKELGYYQKLSLADKTRLVLFKKNRKLYKVLIQMRRNIINVLKHDKL